MKHTKEWILTETWQEAIIHSDNSGTIAHIPNDDINWKAHAHLIIAAPRLLEACKKALEFFPYWYEKEARSFLQQAINKAERS